MYIFMYIIYIYIYDKYYSIYESLFIVWYFQFNSLTATQLGRPLLFLPRTSKEAVEKITNRP